MRFLAKSEVNDGGNPVVDLWNQVGGQLQNPTSIEFEVFDKIDPASPTSIVARRAMNVDEDFPAGDRISTGHFAPNFTIPPAANKGLHEVRFFLVQQNSTQEIEFAFDFDVIDSVFKPPHRVYALLSDVRAEDIPNTQASDQRVLQSLLLASQQIERFTDRAFGAQGKTIQADGRNSPDLLLNEEIIGLSEIQIASHAFGAEFIVADTALENVGIYNRHLRGLTDPDDRDNPKISFFRLHDHFGNHFGETRPLFPHHIFPFGQQNVRVAGVFGYTDPDGSPQGSVPSLIRHACVLLTGRFVDKRFSGASSNLVPAGPIVEEKTRSQSVKYAKPTTLGGAAFGPYTGDPAIDNILLMYSKTTRIGAA